MTGRFAGKTALVTGAASGIGLAVARALCVEGANVVLADLNGKAAADHAAALREAGHRADSFAVDVADFAACEAMVAHTLKCFGSLDIAINNAGMPSGIGGAFEDFEVDAWNRMIAVNLSGVFHCMKAQVPALKAAGGGAIVNTASIASLVAAKGMASYVAAKHGVAGLTKAAALDLIDDGIRVNAVCPGFVGTAMLQPLLEDPAMEAQLGGMVPIGRIASAAEIADAILYLASDAASYCVGSLLALDGGVTAQ